jgi:hypothetical protein
MESPARLDEEQFDISIAFDGTWLHQGAPMTRMPLVRLFAGVLRRDAAGEYWLITPVERGRIQVADAPFIATSWRMDGDILYLTDNLGRETPVNGDHPLALRLPKTGGGPFIPYHQLGGGIEARLATAVYYDLVDRALAGGGVPEGGRLTISSAGMDHPLGVNA